MNNFLKKLAMFSLIFISALGLISSNLKSVYAESFLSVSEVKEGSFIVAFPKGSDVNDDDFDLSYKISGKSSVSIDVDCELSGTTNNYDNFLITYDKSFYEDIEEDTEVLFEGIYDNDDNMKIKFTYNYKASGTSSSDDNTFTLQNPTKNTIEVKFTERKSNLKAKDFSTTINANNANSNISIKSIKEIDKYTYTLTLNSDFPGSSSTQSIKITVYYKNESANKTFTLYSDGTTVGYDLTSEYSNLRKPVFSVKSLVNGKVEILFDDVPKSTLSASDFKIEYYVNGSYKGLATITNIEKDNASNKTHYLYFNKIASTTDKQVISLLVFYTGEGDRQPATENFKIDANNSNEVTIAVKSLLQFDGKITIPEVSIKEKGTDVIYYATKNRVEYIRLEAPEGFEWTKKADVTGLEALKGVIENEVKYATVNGKEQKNILLIGIINAEKDRNKSGTININSLELTATINASVGEVKVNVSGAGIPDEKVSFAVLTKKPEPEKPVVTSEYIVTVVDGQSQINVNGKVVSMDTKPFITNDRFVLPVSHIAVAFGVPATQENINWDPINRKVKVIDGETTVELTIGSNVMIVNGAPVNMDTPALITDDRTFIPMRSLAEALGFNVSWNPVTRTATLKKVVTQ